MKREPLFPDHSGRRQFLKKLGGGLVLLGVAGGGFVAGIEGNEVSIPTIPAGGGRADPCAELPPDDWNELTDPGWSY